MCQMSKTLGEFILNEMQGRDMSARQFAKYVGVSYQTINRLLNYNDPKNSDGYPSLDSLIKISKKLQIDVCSLIALIDPAISAINPDARLLSQKIQQLDEHTRDMIDSIIIGETLKRRNEDT